MELEITHALIVADMGAILATSAVSVRFLVSIAAGQAVAIHHKVAMYRRAHYVLGQGAEPAPIVTVPQK
jgi:hypothetical protein